MAAAWASRHWPRAASRHPRAVHVALTALLLFSVCHAHMEMSHPFPINSQLDPAVPEPLKDYSYTSPLDASGADFPCKGFQNQRPAVRSAAYVAGRQYTLDIAGSAPHDGGSCQISLSYDNGRSFRVIKSMIGGCPLTTRYAFTVPAYAPAGDALLAWTWMNHVGNREYYMNCAWVSVASHAGAHAGLGAPLFDGDTGGSEKNGTGGAGRDASKRRTKQGPATRGKMPQKSSAPHGKLAGARRLARRKEEHFTAFDQLPFIWKANLPPENDCVTVEGVDPVFPHPGPDVVYGAGLSASSPPSSDHGCDSRGPPGPTYKDIPVGQFGSYAAVGSGSGYSVGGGGGGDGTTSSTTASTSTTISSSTLSSTKSSTLTATSSPILPSTTEPTQLPGMPTESPISSTLRHDKCDSSDIEQGLRCLRGGQGFAICDNDRWVDMGSVAFGTKCQGAAGRGVIVAANWATPSKFT